MAQNTFTSSSGTQLVSTGGVNLVFSNGNITNNGTINDASGTVIFTGATTLSGTGTTNLNNLNISANANVTLTKKVNLFGALITDNGITLNSGDGNLVFRNTYTSTARIAQINSNPTFTGTVIVENNINNASRGWRLLGSPLTSGGSGGSVTPTIASNWQSAMGFSGNYGTNIYSPNGGLGMDGTSLRHSLLRFNADTLTVGGWTNINTTNVNLFNADAQNSSTANNPVFFIFIRGDKSVTTGVNQPFVATTLGAKGRITFGDKTVNLTGKTAGFAAVTNPFICPVNLAAVSTTGITGTFYCWNPSLNANVGGWAALNSSNSFTLAGMQPQMQIGQGALVQFNTGINTGTVVFEEADKVSTLRTAQTGAGNGLQDNLRTYLKLINADGSKTDLDELFIGFKNGYHIGFVATEDAEKMNNSGENLSSRIGDKIAAVDVRPYIMNRDTIFLHFTNTRLANYQFEFSPTNFDATVSSVKLIDKFLNTETPISLSNTTPIQFNVTATPGSNAAERFIIVFEGTGNLPNNKLQLVAYKKDKDIQLSWKIGSELGVKDYELQHSSDGVNFKTIDNQLASNKSEYQILDTKANASSNFYRVKVNLLNDNFNYSNVLSINFNQQQQSQFSLITNPVTSHVAQLKLQDVLAGEYTIKVIDLQGKLLYTQKIQHAGGTSTRSLNLNNIAAGTYQLVLEGKAMIKTVPLIKAL